MNSINELCEVMRAKCASHVLGNVTGTRPLIQGIQPLFNNTTPNGYILSVINTGAGAANVSASLFVTCIS